MAETITSRKNPLLVQVRKLAASRALRRETGLFLGDGVKLLEEALRWNAPLEAVILSQGVPLPAIPKHYRRAVGLQCPGLFSDLPIKSPSGDIEVHTHCLKVAVHPGQISLGGGALLDERNASACQDVLGEQQIALQLPSLPFGENALRHRATLPGAPPEQDLQ